MTPSYGTDSFFQEAHWLDTCGHHVVTLNPDKFAFAQDSVEFAGFEITLTTVKPCKKYIRAILDFPKLNNITDVRSWFDLVNKVSYAFSMTKAMLPFREVSLEGLPPDGIRHIQGHNHQGDTGGRTDL